MIEPVKQILVVVPAHVKYNFMQKIKFYELDSRNVIGVLMQKFIDGDFDDLFNIPKD